MRYGREPQRTCPDPLWRVARRGLRRSDRAALAATGSSGFKGLSGRIGSVEWVAGVLFVVALVGGAAGAALHVDAAVLRSLAAGGLKTAGIVLFALGALATVAAQAAMGASWRIGVDETETTQLVTDGPFALARNPIFTTMVVTALGLFLIVPNVVTFVAFLALLLALELQVRVVEEPYLLKKHGDSYRDYARKVGRFVPWLGRLR